MRYILIYLVTQYDLLLLALGLSVFLYVSTRKKGNKSRHWMYSVITTNIVLSIIMFTSRMLQGSSAPRGLVLFFAYLSFLIKPSVITLYLTTTTKKTKYMYFFLLPLLINFLVYSTCFFSNAAFTIDANNQIVYGVLGYTDYLICGFIFVSIFMHIFYRFRLNDREMALIYIFFAITCASALIVGLIFPERDYLLCDAVIICCTFLYMYSINTTNVEKEKQYLIQTQRQNTALMLSQIQPHFIYNTLTTIRVLCQVDPDLAADTIKKFSDYLRINMDALNRNYPVPISDEIKHALVYSDIEKLRFDNIEVNFDVEDSDFSLPILTIQPLVENAVKYGIRSREHGIVNVHTYKQNGLHVVEVEDNGIGFDPENLTYDGKNHIGIKNVKSRVETMMNGTFIIESERGIGTKITIIVGD